MGKESFRYLRQHHKRGGGIFVIPVRGPQYGTYVSTAIYLLHTTDVMPKCKL
jgi:hypothetical protein